MKKLKNLNKRTVNWNKNVLNAFLTKANYKVEDETCLPEAHALYINKNLKNKKLRKFCLITGRNRGHYSKLRISRTQIRDLANTGVLTGLKKSSW